MIFSRKNSYVLEINGLVSGENPVSFVDPGSFSRLLYHQQTACKVTFCTVSQQVN